MKVSVQIIDKLACVLLFLSGLALFLQLIAVPSEWALNMPSGCQCQAYAASKRGWGCARFGSIFTNVFPGLVAIIVATFCAVWLGRKRAALVLLLYFVFVLGLSGLLGFIYFLQGYAKGMYGVLALFSIIVAGGCCLFLNRYLPGSRNVRQPSPGQERARQEKVAQGIEIEIAERLAEKMRKNESS